MVTFWTYAGESGTTLKVQMAGNAQNTIII